MRLSKSKFTQGLGCHRALWWTVHEPDAPEREVGPELQALFDQGTRVGELARGHVPGGYLVDFPYTESERRIEATRVAISAGAPVIYEAAFREDEVFVAVDILHRAPDRRRGRGWTLTEVKSTTKVKGEHVPDAAVQRHVLQRAGLPVTRVEVMHLNRACRYPDLTNLFTRADVTDEVESYLPQVAPEVRAQLTMLRRSRPPTVEPGPHCNAPYACPFLNRCWPEASGPAPARPRPQAPVLAEGLRAELDALEAPVAHLDFETINPAVPEWDGCRPYDQVPVQFSVHTEPRRAGGVARHVGWLAEGGGDPRGPLAHALVQALRGARTVIVYHAPFEIGRLRELQVAVPELADELESIIARVVDLLPLVRAYVSHPDFAGRFGLKKVAPALVPGLRYDGLEIGEGGEASRALEALLLRPETMRKAERARVRRALLAYCALDTLATMGVLARLRELA